MPRIIAIDYGTKRVGLAVTDPHQMIATGLTTVHSSKVIAYLKKYLSVEDVTCFVVGEPKRMNNEPSSVAPSVELFVKSLQKEFPDTPIMRMDERFTSGMALQAMIDGGVKKQDRQNKAMVDEISATIILQSYLEHLQHKKDIGA